jgi:MYXO-CTERM domain-containing protein
MRQHIALFFGFFVLAWFATAFAAPTVALAQTIAASAQPYPDRLSPIGTDLGVSTRPQDLTPLGISHQDCIDDQSLQFSVTVAGFSGQDIQIWASQSADCTQPTNVGIGGVASCWRLSGGLAAVNQTNPTTIPFRVRVQDIVGRQTAPPNPPTYVAQGPGACNPSNQPSYVAETLTLYFVPFSNGSPTGTAYSYQLLVDLEGPPAPAIKPIQSGDKLLIVNWTPNSDTDTIGYDVFMDPIPGHEGVEGGVSPGRCSGIDPVLTESVAGDAGATVVIGDATDETATIETNSGGLSYVPEVNLVGASGLGVTVLDKSTGAYTQTGLESGVGYHVVVSAVDGFGNIGPPSAQSCDFPTPDRNDGGMAGGGCAVVEAGPSSSLGAGALAVAAGVLVRRRRRTSR